MTAYALTTVHTGFDLMAGESPQPATPMRVTSSVVRGIGGTSIVTTRVDVGGGAVLTGCPRM